MEVDRCLEIKFPVTTITQDVFQKEARTVHLTTDKFSLK